MSKENEQVRRFGFAQFRFVVSAVLLLAAGLKAWQLGTAPLPPVVQGSMFTPLLELLNDRYFLMMVVVCEIFFALVLIVDLCRSWAWLLSLLGFAAFALVSLMKGLSGEASCGCFGTITINPWYTMVLDLVILAFLAVFRERIDWSFPPLNWKKVQTVLLIWFVLAGLALWGMLSLTQRTHATLGKETIGLDNRLAIDLEPERWLGKEFPLIERFSEPHEGEVLKQGEWTVLLIHTDCPKCKKMMRELEEKKIEKVAIVVVPFLTGERMPQMDFPAFWLDRRNGWYADTPCIVRLVNGVCVAVEEVIGE